MFHTFFGIAGLAFIGQDGVRPIDAAYALPVHTMERLRRQQSGGGNTPGGARAEGTVQSFIESSFTTRVEYDAWRRGLGVE